MHMDPDSGFLVPDDPIPDFGASLVDLAFDDQTLSSVLQSSTEATQDISQPTTLQSSVSQFSGFGRDVAPQEIVGEVLAKHTKSPFKG